MEVWALEGFNVANISLEMLTYKSDHIRVHQKSTRNYDYWWKNTKTWGCFMIFLIVRSRTTIFNFRTESFPCIWEWVPDSKEDSLIGLNHKFYSMIDQYNHQHLRIGSISPRQWSAWAKKTLYNGEIVGEVTKPFTFHYKPTLHNGLRPEPKFVTSS